MTASTMSHHTARSFATRPGRSHIGRPATATVADRRPQRPDVLSRELDCEAGCHYCEGPETD